ncbi:MAG TPA: 3-phosphoshikimate 1-carboxyvinyltransferase [Pyrinomonadaceae bacterium]|nr:3-phosphoshikimate 1-carboxyvinyltransferase [Pyrinomonadaceae bacterium]
MKISPARRITGRVSVPGDKSISHRAALIAALASQSSQISNFSSSRDCASTLTCLQALGVTIEREGDDVLIEGVGNGRFVAPTAPLDCGNSGSTMRMIAGILAGQEFTSTLTGDDSLRSRPMARIVEPLERMGARVIAENEKPPLRIEGRQPLSAIRYQLPVASAQVKSCVLLAALNAHGRTEVVEPVGFKTRDHTERMLKWFGVPVENGDDIAASCAVVGPASFSGREVRVPGDFSSAAFLIAAAALLPGSELEIENLGLNPTRTRFLHALRSAGAGLEVVGEWEDCNEPVGTVSVRGTWQPGPWKEVGGPMVASLIDELPLLAVVGTQVPGGLVIRDAAELRTKESDRIAATVSNLRAMGALVEKYDDGLAVEGPVTLQGATLNAYGDHRIAMAFTVAALIARGDSEILGSDCVEISFPGFFERIESMVER